MRVKAGSRRRRLWAAVKVALWGLLGLGIASQIAVLAFGHFAARARGEASYALAVEPDATVLDRLVGPLTDAHPGQTGLVLHTSNLDAFVVRALTARAAGRSLDLQYYLWHDDLTGRLLGAEVLAAADRGVRVRFILDDINAHGEDAGLRAFDEHPNIEVRMYNPGRNRSSGIGRGFELLLRGFSLNRRMHNKAWIADGRIAVVGGRNIGDEYFDASEAANFLDADLAMVGPAVAESSAIFDTFWNSAAVIPIAALVDADTPGLPRLREELPAATAGEDAQLYLHQLTASGSIERNLGGQLPAHWSSDVTVRSDPPLKSDEEFSGPWLVEHVRHALEQARERIEVTSPYFVPGEEGVRWCQSARSRGVEVAILTNSLAATDVKAVHSGYAPYRAPLLRDGVELFELMPTAPVASSAFGSSGASLHTKAFTVDDELGFVGSFNFDPRSASLNTEMGVFFRSRSLVAALRAEFAEKTSGELSYRVLLEEGELRWEDHRDTPPSVWSSEPDTGWLDRAATRAIGWLPIELQL